MGGWKTCFKDCGGWENEIILSKIGWGNEIILSKIGWGNELKIRSALQKILLSQLGPQKSGGWMALKEQLKFAWKNSLVDGWMGVWMDDEWSKSRFKDCLQQSKTWI